MDLFVLLRLFGLFSQQGTEKKRIRSRVGIKKSSWDKNLQRGKKLMDIFMTVEALHSDAHPLSYNLCSSSAQQEVHYIEDNAVERQPGILNLSLDHH